MTYTGEWELEDFYADCPACGDPVDYCPGHGEQGDPEGCAAAIDRLDTIDKETTR